MKTTHITPQQLLYKYIFYIRISHTTCLHSHIRRNVMRQLSGRMLSAVVGSEGMLSKHPQIKMTLRGRMSISLWPLFKRQHQEWREWDANSCLVEQRFSWMIHASVPLNLRREVGQVGFLWTVHAVMKQYFNITHVAPSRPSNRKETWLEKWLS